MPAACACSPEKLFPTAEMVTLDEPPTVNVTGMSITCGNVLIDWITSVAWTTPGESPAEDAATVICPGPVPDSGYTVSQLVLGLAGSTAAVQFCPAGTVTVTTSCTDADVLELSATCARDARRVPAFATAA